MSEPTTQPTTAPPSTMHGPVAGLMWACFLGCSWTWVVGMLLPILLVRDYGLWGWVVFAVPNVVGAAAMGFVIVTPARSRAMTARHREAALRFSEITIAFHVFAVGWAYHRLFDNWGLLATAAIVLLTLALARQRTVLLAGAVAVTVISIAMFNVWSAAHGVALQLPDAPRLTGLDLLAFAPAAVVGFALCPYLDLTFHRARQQTGVGTGRLAFGAGFGVVFLVMIGFSLWYAHELGWLFAPQDPVVLPGTLQMVLLTHLTVQAGFTLGLHVREVAVHRGHAGLHRMAVLAIAAGALAYWALSEPWALQHGRSVGEVVYRVFLLFYGLAFPGYVFLCMIPTLRPVAWGPRLAVALAGILAGLPLAYVGFVVGQAWAMPAAVGVLLAARAVIEWALPRAKTPHTGDGPGPEGPPA